MTDNKTEELLATVLDKFIQTFNTRAVLRGGMVLRILGSERLTNDLDYVFVPHKSKNEIVDEVVSCLQSIPGAEITHSLNSKCLRAVVTAGQCTIQVETKVAKNMKTATASTRLLSPQYGLQPRLIKVMDYDIALSNKLAAWNERRLIRDIYDIWFYLRMNVLPDTDTLKQRLRKPLYSRLVKESDKFAGDNITEFYEFLRKKVAVLTDSNIQQELLDYLPKEAIPGLAMQFMSELTKLK